MERDFNKVLEALTIFDKKLSKVEKTLDALMPVIDSFMDNQVQVNKNTAEALKATALTAITQTSIIIESSGIKDKDSRIQMLEELSKKLEEN